MKSKATRIAFLAVWAVAIFVSGCQSNLESNGGFTVGDYVKSRASDDDREWVVTRISQEEARVIHGNEHKWVPLVSLKLAVEEKEEEIDLSNPTIFIVHEGRYKEVAYTMNTLIDGRVGAVIIDPDVVHRTPNFTVEPPKPVEHKEEPLKQGDPVQFKLGGPVMIVSGIDPETGELRCGWVGQYDRFQRETFHPNELVRYVVPPQAEFAHLVMPAGLE